MDMIDLHTHILPGVDDGADNMAESLQMLSRGAGGGTVMMVATPHCNVPCLHYTQPGELHNRLGQLAQAARAEGIPVELRLGGEVHVTDDLPERMKRGDFTTLCGSRYLLTEFPGWTDEGHCNEMLERLLAAGYTPLVAHPERYALVAQNPKTVERWLKMGCHIQLTAASILGKFGREARQTAWALLDGGLVACVASDAHGVQLRTSFLEPVCAFLEERYSFRYARMLLWDHPLAIVEDREL